MTEDASRPHAAIGERVRAMRLAFTSDSLRTFAQKMGVSPMAVSGWETGFRRIPVESAERYCDMFGVTLDWIYRGRRDCLSENASKIL